MPVDGQKVISFVEPGKVVFDNWLSALDEVFIEAEVVIRVGTVVVGNGTVELVGKGRVDDSSTTDCIAIDVDLLLTKVAVYLSLVN